MQYFQLHLLVTTIVCVVGVDVDGSTDTSIRKPGTASPGAVTTSPVSVVSAGPAQGSGSPTLCTRNPPGGPLIDSPSIRSILDFQRKERILNTTFTFNQENDEAGNQLSCFLGPQGQLSPTLIVKSKDRIIINLVDNAPKTTGVASVMTMKMRVCGSAVVDSSSVNLHFHGMSISPKCGQDDVFAAADAGQSLVYDFNIPHHATPGVYPYHFHIHGFTETAILGGASGLIVVEGVENIHPQLAGLPDRLITVRDHIVEMNVTDDQDDEPPGWDLDVNFSPINWPNYTSPYLPVKPGEMQYVRLSASVADSSLRIQYVIDGEPQPLTVFSRDAYPVAQPFNTTSIDLGPFARAEFTITTPTQSNQTAQLITLEVETGPDGDYNPSRPLLNLVIDENASAPAQLIPQPTSISKALIYNDLPQISVSRTRKIYFSELLSDPSDSDSPTNFYITEEGNTPALFDSDAPPAIVVEVGTVEDWVIENRAKERHVFHIHQGHFLVLERDGVPVPRDEALYLDTIPVEYWSGNDTDPYPFMKFRIDFRQIDEGEYVFHCHFLGHEDGGMMAILRVVNQTTYASMARSVWSVPLISATTVAVVMTVALIAVAIGMGICLCRARRANKSKALSSFSTPTTTIRRESVPSSLEPIPFHIHNTADAV